jgi:hypothetical protein
MWNWISCYLSGRHEFGVSCEPGAVFLRCVHCGRRSQGWALHDKLHRAAQHEAPPVGTIPPLQRFDSARTARGQ